MDVEALISAALREAGYGPDAIGSALPRIMRILDAEDVRVAVGRSLSRKEREYVRVQLELGLSVSADLLLRRQVYAAGTERILDVPRIEATMAILIGLWL